MSSPKWYKFLLSLLPLIAPPPSVTIDGPATITAGQTVVLVCNVSRDVMVTWSRNDGRPLPNTPDGNVLHIPMPGVEDGGVYRCTAEGVVATFNLVVMEPPTTSEKPMYDVTCSSCMSPRSKTIMHCSVSKCERVLTLQLHWWVWLTVGWSRNTCNGVIGCNVQQ